GIRKFLAFGDGFTANLAGRIYGVLGQDRVDDFWNGDRKFGELIRLDPEAHRILAGAEDLHAADAVEAGDLVAEIDVGEVGKKLSIVGAVRGIESDEHQRGGDGFLDGDAVVGDVDGQLRGGLGGAQLREDEIGIGVGFYVVVDDEAHEAVGSGVEGVHVIHVVDATHLLLDGSGDGLFDGLGVSANVGGENLHFWRNDIGEKSNR